MVSELIDNSTISSNVAREDTLSLAAVCVCCIVLLVAPEQEKVPQLHALDQEDQQSDAHLLWTAGDNRSTKRAGARRCTHCSVVHATTTVRA